MDFRLRPHDVPSSLHPRKDPPGAYIGVRSGNNNCI